MKIEPSMNTGVNEEEAVAMRDKRQGWANLSPFQRGSRTYVKAWQHLGFYTGMIDTHCTWTCTGGHDWHDKLERSTGGSVFYGQADGRQMQSWRDGGERRDSAQIEEEWRELRSNMLCINDGSPQFWLEFWVRQTAGCKETEHTGSVRNCSKVWGQHSSQPIILQNVCVTDVCLCVSALHHSRLQIHTHSQKGVSVCVWVCVWLCVCESFCFSQDWKMAVTFV